MGKSLGKFLQEIVVENCCGKLLWKMLWEIVAGKSYGKFLRDNLAGNCCRNSCGKFL